MSLVSEQGEFNSFNSFGDYIILPLVDTFGNAPKSPRCEQGVLLLN